MTKTADATSNTSPSERAKAIISLTVDPQEDEIPSEYSTQFTLKSQPTEADSPKYKVTTRVLQGNESVRQILGWHSQTNKVCTGLNLTTYVTKMPVIESMLNATPLSLFKAALTKYQRIRQLERIEAAADDPARDAIRAQPLNHDDNCNVEDIGRAVKDLVQALLPRRVLARVKRFIRRECRKPADMTVRKYFQNILRLNTEILPKLPPFGPFQTIPDEELTDILLFGMPKTWQKEMDKQGFDPLESNVYDVVNFMERIEATEDFDSKATTAYKIPKKSKKGSPGGSKKDNKKPGFYCTHHGENHTHDSKQCFVLHPELKKSKNKSWSKRASDGHAKTKADLNAFIQAEVAKGIKKGVKVLAAFDKKRKARSEDSSDDDLCAFDLKAFDYSKLQNLSLSDEEKEDGEISV